MYCTATFGRVQNLVVTYILVYLLFCKKPYSFMRISQTSFFRHFHETEMEKENLRKFSMSYKNRSTIYIKNNLIRLATKTR